MGNIDNRIVEQFNQRAPFKLQDATLLVLAKIGSHSHGTYVPPSDPQAIDDVDYMGIVIPPPSYTLGLKNWEGLNFQFEELDCVFYSFRKFVNLLLKSNPNVIGMLWLLPEFYISQSHEWNLVVAARDKFSSKMVYPSFMGYAHGQLEKMESFDAAAQIELENCLEELEDLGLTFSDVSKPDFYFQYPFHKDGIIVGKLSCWPYSYDIVAEIIQKAADLSRKYFSGYMGQKRRDLVKKHGYDTKNAAHLIRLMRMCSEFLKTGNMRVYRDVDGNQIRAIKAGKYTLDEIKTHANELFELTKKVKDESSLPDKPDTEAIDRLVQSVHLLAYGLDKMDLGY